MPYFQVWIYSWPPWVNAAIKILKFVDVKREIFTFIEKRTNKKTAEYFDKVSSCACLCVYKLS